MSTQKENYGKAIYDQICQDIKNHVEINRGIKDIQSLKSINASDMEYSSNPREVDLWQQVDLCMFLEDKYKIEIKDEHVAKLTNLEKFAAYTCGAVLSKRLKNNINPKEKEMLKHSTLTQCSKCRQKIKEFLEFFCEYTGDYFSGQKWKQVKQQKTR